MRALVTRCPGRFAFVATALLTGNFMQPEHAAAQYVYQPPPSYYQNDTATGTVAGGAFGAVTGAILGGRKDRGEGALIGASIGAITGNLLGRARDTADERQAAAGAATVGALNQQAVAAAITNYDLLEMTRAGLSEDVIISTMRSRGARLDLSPQSLIALKQSGVSDRVVMAAQDMNSGRTAYLPTPAIAPVPVVREVVPTRVIVHDPWPYYGCRPYYHHHHWHRPHTHVHIGF